MSQSTPLNMGARAAGLAYCTTALTGADAVFNNIASLSSVSRAEVMVTAQQYFSFTGYRRSGIALAIPIRKLVLGAGMSGTGDDLYSENTAQAGLSHLIDKTSLGIRVSFVQHRTETTGTTNNIGIQAGGITQITPGLRWGAFISNINQIYARPDPLNRMPIRMSTGVVWQPAATVCMAAELEKELPYAPAFKTALELTILKKAFARCGFRMNPNRYHAGIGLKSSHLRIDYAFEYGMFLPAAHQVSVVYQLKPSTHDKN